jgi:predicted ribonuclease toxin of YeeF-YezG toxin-antitoxin module
MEKIKEIIRKKLAEMSATGAGGASFSPGENIGYTPKKAFKKVNEGPGATLGMGPKAGPEGVKDNAYIKQFKYKLVPKNPKPKSFDIKKLWEDETLNEMNDVQKRRIASLDEIEKLMNEIQPLVSNAKNETIELYGGNAGSYDINKPIEIVLSYLKEIKQLLSEK